MRKEILSLHLIVIRVNSLLKTASEIHVEQDLIQIAIIATIIQTQIIIATIITRIQTRIQIQTANQTIIQMADHKEVITPITNEVPDQAKAKDQQVETLEIEEITLIRTRLCLSTSLSQGIHNYILSWADLNRPHLQ